MRKIFEKSLEKNIFPGISQEDIAQYKKEKKEMKLRPAPIEVFDVSDEDKVKFMEQIASQVSQIKPKRRRSSKRRAS